MSYLFYFSDFATSYDEERTEQNTGKLMTDSLLICASVQLRVQAG
jgi:hypothetical protein